jgi:hypothetical protein
LTLSTGLFYGFFLCGWIRDGLYGYGPLEGLTFGLHILAHVVLLVSGILGIIGALKNNKCLLIPFIIGEGLTILACVGTTNFFVFLANQRTKEGLEFLFYAFLIPVLIALGLSIYFLTISIKFYQELSSRVVDRRTEGFALQPYISPL